MKLKIIIASLGSLLVSQCIGAEYVIPPQWENVKNSEESHRYVLITNVTGYMSTNSYDIGTKKLKLRCESIPKIRCANGYTQKVYSKIITIITKEPKADEIIKSYGHTLVSESNDNFNICAGAIGAVVWDNSEVVEESDGTKTYVYEPLKEKLEYYFFTNATGDAVSENGTNGGAITGSDKSYMVVETMQTCEI